MEPDFSGYATKAGLECSDGRTIMPDAFKHQDQVKVPLVWHHGGQKDPENVLGHVLLDNKKDGVYCRGFFNETPKGKATKQILEHGDIDSLSIWANGLVEKSKQVFHGFIREVSLVMTGANPGAKIDFVSVRHADGEVDEFDDVAIITTGLLLDHVEHADSSSSSDTKDNTKDDTKDDGPTVQDVYDSMSPEQKNIVHFMIGEAIDAATSVSHSDESEDTVSDDTESSAETDESEDTSSEDTADTEQSEDTSSEDKSEDTSSEDDSETDGGDLAHQEGKAMTRNVFDENDVDKDGSSTPHLSHDQLKTIVADAQRTGSFKEAFLSHAEEYGITDIDMLFPDFQKLANSPELVSRKQEWVAAFMSGVKKSPFSRIKTLSADVTLDEARAKGYVKGSLKKEEWFGLQKRTTSPTTIYKKQKLDRDDILDITELDVVAWLKAEMRLMLEEEVARAGLVGDGREIDDEDKIDETCIRPIAFEDDFYAHKVQVPANVTGDALIETILRSRPLYRGSGTPTLFTTEAMLTDLLLIKDKMGRRLYNTPADLALALRVDKVVTVPVMEVNDVNGGDIMGILVNLSDYTIGTNQGGQVSMFDDFDIDYNQYKYLIETRLSGALTKFKSAQVFTRAAGTQVTPDVPTFDANTGVVTIPADTGVIYTQDDVVVTAGAQTAIAAGESTEIVASADNGYYFPHNTDADWTFTRNL